MAMTAAVKDELSRVDVPKPCCRRAEMAALLRFAGGLHIVSGRVVVEAELDTGAVARRLRREIAEVYGYPSEVHVLAYGGRAVDPWWQAAREKLERQDRLTVLEVPAEAGQALARLAARHMKLQVTIQDGHVFVADDADSIPVTIRSLKAADTGHLVFSTLHTTDATQTINRVLSFYPPHQQSEVRFALSTALAAVISLRLVPRADKPGRVPAAEVLINTAAVREQIRDLNATLNIPDLIKEGTSQYGMQSFDQSLMQWYSRGVISYESALFYASNPSEFALRVQGVAASSDTSWDGFQQATAP